MYETPITNGINYLSTGAGFQPSTVHPLRIGLWDPFQMAISMAKKMMVILTTCKSWDVPPSSRWCYSCLDGWGRDGGDVVETALGVNLKSRGNLLCEMVGNYTTSS